MSYEILYGRQFISLENGKYLPLILSGSNNCTMFHNGREIRERNWWSLGAYGRHTPMAKTKEEWMKWITERTEDSPEQEWFMRGGKWLLGKDMVTWMDSGIKSARSIEEILSILPSQSLHCFINIYDKSKSYGDKGYQHYENGKFVRTTKELIKWIDEFEERKNTKAENESVSACIEFSGIEPLKLGTKPSNPNRPVICKIGNAYLHKIDADKGTYTYGYISEAMVFENEEDFLEKNKGLIRKYKLVSANQPEKNYIIVLNDGYNKGLFVKRKTSRQLMLAQYTTTAMKFQSEAVAQRYIDTMLAGRYPSCKSFVVRNIKDEGEKKDV